MVYSASIAIAEGSRFTDYQSHYLPAAPRGLPRRRHRPRPGGLPAADGALAAARPGALRRRRGPAGGGADPGHRARGQWRAALALARSGEPAALRAHEDLRRALRRRLHGAQARRHGQLHEGLRADDGGDPAGRLPAAARARLRRLRRDHHDRLRRALPRRRERARVRAARGGGGDRLRDPDLDLALPPRPHLRLHGPLAGRLSARATSSPTR